MNEVKIGAVTIRVWMDTLYLETVFEDGAKVGAAPEPQRDIQTARSYGYRDDTTGLWLDHDPAHSWLAVKKGLRVSPTLWAVAHERADSGTPTWEEQAAEEAYVLDFQRFVQTGDNWREFPEEWAEEFRAFREQLRGSAEPKSNLE